MTNIPLQLCPSSWVKDIQTPEGAALLDIDQGIYFSMNPVGARIWNMLKVRSSIEDIACSLAAEFRLSDDLVRNDVLQFINLLEAQRLLVRESKTHHDNRSNLVFSHFRRASSRFSSLLEDIASRRRDTRSARFGAAAAFGELLLYNLLIRTGGFKEVCRSVRALRVAQIDRDPEAVVRILHALERACVFYPQKVLCLQRSFVITRLLRSAGTPAQLVIGVRKIPFKAHAWVEVEGVPVNEGKRVREFFQVIEEC